MASDIKSVVYTTDSGKQYNVGIDAAVFAQVGASTARKVGGADYTGTPALDPMPRNLRPRTVTVSNGSKKRRVLCLTPTAELFTGTETAINLTDGAGATGTYVRYRATGERYQFARDPQG